MKYTLVFDDWRQKGKIDSIYNTSLGIELSLGDLHSGTVFEAEVTLPSYVEKEIKRAMDRNEAYPVFRLFID